MDKLYPRRRDVRARLRELHEALRAEAHYEFDGVVYTEEDLTENSFAIVDIVDYDHDFLTEVRDLMRAGVGLEDAVMAVSCSDEDEAAELLHGDGRSATEADEAEAYFARIARQD